MSKDTEDPVLTELLERSADLRLSRVKAEREFLKARGEALSKEEQAALEKKRHEILYQLELEGAEIERDFTEKYRARLAGLGSRFPGLGGGGLSLGCHIACESCITSSCLTCVACASCISPCTNAIF
jgi:tartrate dehydratase alpha subunit/fumarate hydratase class I-like protein